MSVTDAHQHFSVFELKRNLAELFVFWDLGLFCSVQCWNPWQERDGDMHLCIPSLETRPGLGEDSMIICIAHIRLCLGLMVARCLCVSLPKPWCVSLEQDSCSILVYSKPSCEFVCHHCDGVFFGNGNIAVKSKGPSISGNNKTRDVQHHSSEIVLSGAGLSLLSWVSLRTRLSFRGFDVVTSAPENFLAPPLECVWCGQ